MIGKKINQLATELAPASTDLTIIGNPTTGVSKKITLAQLGAIFSGAVSFYTNLASFPATGTLDVIFCAKDTQKLYLWSGSAYVEVFPSQALLDTYQLRSEKGVSNGYASLDSTGKVPISQLPSSIMEYKGTWNAATNTPTLANGTGDTGDVYICNVAGTVNFGAGAITFAVGDYVIYSGSIWQRSSGAVGTVTSVAASITGDAIGITGSPVTTSGTLAFSFAGTGAQYIKGDGTLATFPSTIAQAERLITEVYNSTGATLTKGTIVYINGGQGNLPTVTKALATGDSTSAQTFGVVQADITNNNNGYVVVAGKLSDLDTQAYTEGTQLYLSATTAGTWTSTKQYAPAHLVYVGIVVRSHPTQGIVEIKIQNGYEMDELHNVAAQTPTNNDGLFWESATSLWKNKSIATILGGTPVTGSGTLYALTKWGFTSGTIINSNLYDTGSVIYNNNATAGAFAVQFNGNATSGMSYGLLINAGSDANDIALRIQNVSSTSEYFFVYGDGKVKMNNIPNATTDTDTFLVSDGGFIKYRTGAQLLSDIGGQAALTNPVTGTGTTNYLPKFTGTSTIGNSLVYDNGTNVGIGTATPYSATNYKFLTIDGTNGSGFVTRVSSINSFLAYSNSGGTTLSEQRALPIVFETTGTSRMTLDASGNLGLGVTPSASTAKTIEVGFIGNSIIGRTTAVIDVASNTYFDSGYKYANNAAATLFQQNNGIYYWFNAPSGTAGNAISFTQAMTLNASGNLSIGNTNDTYKLDVSGTGRFTGAVTATSGTTGAAITLTGTTNYGFVEDANSVRRIWFENTGSYRTLFDLPSAGTNFSFRNSAGTILASIASTGAATFSSSVTATSGFITNSDSEAIGSRGSYKFKGTTGQTSARWWVIKNDDQSFGDFAILQSAANSDATYTEKFYISSTGNVGIGTTSPGRTLEVSKSGGVDFGLTSVSSGSAEAIFKGYASGTNVDATTSRGTALNLINLDTTNGNANAIVFHNSNQLSTSYISAVNVNHTSRTGDLVFGTSNGAAPTERLRITSGGSLLVGTTSELQSATSKLNIAGDFYNANGVSLKTTNGGSGSQFVGFINESGTLIGSINRVTTMNAVAYNTTSDYRLKEDLKSINGLEIVNKIKVYDYKWKSDNSRMDGVLAHELAEVLPYAVTGIKDGEKMQQVDYSKIVPVLIQSVKELKSELDTLKNK